MPDDPRLPKSPDSLERDGLRSRIPGVTRIGPRAFGVAFFVVLLLLLVILYGVLKKPGGQDQTAVIPTAGPIAQATNEGHFGQDVPIVPTAPPMTPPPPIVLPPSPVPNVESSTASVPAPVLAPATESPGEVAEDARMAKVRADRDAADKARREALEAAIHSKILTGQNSNQAGGTGASSDGNPVQLSFAGNGSDAASNGATQTGSSGVAGGAGGGTSGNSLVGRNASYSEPTPDPNAFLSGPTNQYGRPTAANITLPVGGNPKDFLQAQRFRPISPFQIMAGSILPAATITGIDTDIPGFVTAQIREDIFDTKTGRYLLVPKGTKLFGIYKNNVQYGQSRVQVAWTRLIFPDTTSIDLQDMSGSDTEGFAGFGGQVDSHFGKIIGAALLTSVLAAGLQLSQPQQSSVLQTITPGQAVSQSVGTEITNVGTQLIQKDLNIPPTITIPRGYPFLVVVDRDIVLPGPYGQGE
jgi:type IV secretory pathway VirB10-like protein